MEHILQFLNNISGVVTIVFGLGLSYLTLKLNDTLNRFRKALMDEIDQKYVRKPEMDRDRPVREGDFQLHQNLNQTMHLNTNVRLDGYHKRLGVLEEKSSKLDVDKADRKDLREISKELSERIDELADGTGR